MRKIPRQIADRLPAAADLFAEKGLNDSKIEDVAERLPSEANAHGLMMRAGLQREAILLDALQVEQVVDQRTPRTRHPRTTAGDGAAAGGLSCTDR